MPAEHTAVVARKAIDRSGAWLAGLAADRSADLDDEGACLLLFGLACAHNLTEASRDGDWGTIAHRLAERLAHDWTSKPSAIRAEFNARRFVLPLLVAAVSSPWGEVGRLLRSACEREWQVLREESFADDNPILFWTGQRLISLIRGEQPQRLRAKWRMGIETMVPPYAVDPPGARQITAELALLSAYGNFDLELPILVGRYLRAMLPSLMFMYLKDRDLEMVCVLLRALNYMGLRSVPEFSHGIEFVLQHNCRDGYFAMHSMALHLHTVRSERDLRRSVFLPLSVAALWALAECLFPMRAPLSLAGSMSDRADNDGTR
jgi:hypothetical protein